jgi:hypothetical protein
MDERAALKDRILSVFDDMLADNEVQRQALRAEVAAWAEASGLDAKAVFLSLGMDEPEQPK